MIRSGFIEKSGVFRTSENARSLRLVLCGAGGGGASNRFGQSSGCNGAGGDTLEIRVDITPAADYEVVIGVQGHGSDGLHGGGDGGPTIFYLNEHLALIARGGRGGRESGVFERGQSLGGSPGSPGGVFFEEFASSHEQAARERASRPIAELIA